MKELTQFNFNNSQVRATEKDGEVWFIAMDVSSILEYSDSFEMTKRLDRDCATNPALQGGEG